MEGMVSKLTPLSKSLPVGPKQPHSRVIGDKYRTLAPKARPVVESTPFREMERQRFGHMPVMRTSTDIYPSPPPGSVISEVSTDSLLTLTASFCAVLTTRKLREAMV